MTFLFARHPEGAVLPEPDSTPIQATEGSLFSTIAERGLNMTGCRSFVYSCSFIRVIRGWFLVSYSFRFVFHSNPPLLFSHRLFVPIRFNEGDENMPIISIMTFPLHTRDLNYNRRNDASLPVDWFHGPTGSNKIKKAAP